MVQPRDFATKHRKPRIEGEIFTGYIDIVVRERGLRGAIQEFGRRAPKNMRAMCLMHSRAELFLVSQSKVLYRAPPCDVIVHKAPRNGSRDARQLELCSGVSSVNGDAITE